MPEGKTKNPTSALTLGRAMEPHCYPEKPTSAPDPRHLSTDVQTPGMEFSRTEARPGLYPSFHVLLNREPGQVYMLSL